VAAAASSRAALAQQSCAIGCGLTTIALRVSSARRTLKNTVHTGFVDGVSARMTPAGRGTERIFAAGSVPGLTWSSCRYRSNRPSEHASFLRALCSATPKPVSFTAHSA
jgi:hypothetical protein